MYFDSFQRHRTLVIAALQVVLVNVALVETTIDVNVAELQHIADHLEPEECRRLAAALHFHSYDLPKNLDEAELGVARDVSCMRLLLHWNSAPGEGKAESHEVLEHRLRQLGKLELADWLGRTVFHQLGKDLEKSVDSPFISLITDKPRNHKYGPQQVTKQKEKEDPMEWIPFDTLCYVAGVILLVLATGLCVKVLVGYFKRKSDGRSHNKTYSRVEDGYSSSESEDRFDIRHRSL